MTEAQFWAQVVRYATDQPAQRFGQNSGSGEKRRRRWHAAFNVLAMVRPDLSERIRGTDLDPFYVRSFTDKTWRGFTVFITQNWGEV